jgi:hypothetical protein
MWKPIACLFVVVFLAFGSFAEAQTRSLADMPAGEKYVSTEGGFEVRLPKDPRILPAQEFGSTIVWTLKEGVVTINYESDGFESMNLPAGFSRAAKIKAFVDEAKTGYAKGGGIVGETHSSTVGGVDFNFFPVTVNKEPAVFSIFVEEYRSIWILVVPTEKVPGSAELIAKAMETFRLLPKNK